MYYLGVDLGGTNIFVGLVDENGKIISKESTPTISVRSADLILEDLITLCKKVVENNNLELSDIEYVGIGVPGTVNRENGVLEYANNLNFNHTNIAEYVGKALGLPVYLENDANCAALAEVWKGVACHENDCCFIVSGTGIGGAVIKDRHVHHGNALHGGEFGYMIMRYDQDEKKYYTWSDDGSTVAVTKRVAKELDVDYHTLDGKEVFSRKDIPDRLFTITTTCPWTKLYSRKFIEKYKLRFQNLRHSNDVYFVLSSLALAERITYLNEKLVYYRVNQTKSLQSLKATNPTLFFDAYEAVYKLLNERHIYEELEKSFITTVLSGCVFNIDTVHSNDAKRKIYEKIYISFCSCSNGFKFYRLWTDCYIRK